MKRLVAVTFVAFLAVPRTALAGMPGANEAILSSILVENVKQSVDMGVQLSNLTAIIETARNNYEFARATYAVAEGLKTWDTQTFLEDSRSEFMGSNPVFFQGQSLARDISKNGLRGGDPFMIRLLARSDLYRSARKMEDCECGFEGGQLVEWTGGDPNCQLTCIVNQDQAALFQVRRSAGPAVTPTGYDADAAGRLSAGIETSIYDKERRRELLNRDATPNASEAVVFYEIALQDPSAADALLRQRAVAVEAQAAAREDWKFAQKQGPNLNTGTASAITARNTSLAAEQLAAMREAQAKQVAMQQAHVSAEAAAQQKVNERNELYGLHVSEMLFVAVRSLRTPGSTSTSSTAAAADPYAP